jgi:hypothetical protein
MNFFYKKKIKETIIPKYFKLLLNELYEEITIPKNVLLKCLIKTILNETHKRFSHELIKNS